MIIRSVCRLATLLVLTLAAPHPAAALETVPGAPWRPIKGAAETVGTCSTDEFSDIRTCYVVRCEARAGLVFAVQERDLGEMGVRTVRISIGKRSVVLRLEGNGPGERSIALSAHPDLLEGLTSGATWAKFETVKARTDYGTGFDLTGAKPLLQTLAGRCQR